MMSALDMNEEVKMESTTPVANATSPDSMSATPAPNSSTPSTSSSATRRPPRKSTLTQQQKNQKRQRATQDQLITLEQEFNKNPTPTASVRDRIAQDINMTERSVQIWFQNRRAKIKLIAKKSIETGEDCDAIPESYRQYLAMQAMESGKPLARYFPGRIGYPSGVMMNSDASNNSKVVIHHFNCRSLTIGSWRRVGQNAMDLVIFYSPDKACITYYINNDSAGYKIEYPFAHIKNITLESGEGSPNANGIPPRPAGLVIELNRPPNFFMDSSNSGGFYQCGDFTEDQQASQIMMHHLGGHPKVLSVQLAKLVSLESFQNRLMPVAFDMGMNMPSAIAASAPVSPNINRPSSQPSQLPVFQENPYSMGFPGARGHKRQRSRSVPAAIDVSMFHQPMPSFHIQHPSQQFVPDPNIFAPIPQYQNSQQNLGPNLRIDTSSQYGMEFRNPYPMSAATTASPSDYASPGLFTGAPSENGMTAASFNTPYSMPFLSPSPMVDPANMIPPSVSPLSSVSHHEPMIANQSPPLNSMHRSASADMFQFPHDHSSAISDDGLMLSEMYSKQNLNMHVAHTPEGSTPGMQMYEFEPQGSSDGMDMPDLMPFETIDPSNLNQ